MSKRIDQVTVGFRPGDAVSTNVANIQRILRGWGHHSRVFAAMDHVAKESRRDCLPAEDISRNATDILIYHFSIGSSILPYVLDFEGPRIMIYHNITPAHYFSSYNSEVARRLDEGRKQLARVRTQFHLALADSEFNRLELEELGFEETAVLPLFLDPENLENQDPPKRTSFLQADLDTLLFVGRLAPNKKAEDLLKIFSLYQKFYNRRSRLVWIGTWGGAELYYIELKDLVKELNLQNVFFAGLVPDDVLRASYSYSTILTCPSEHEGFCVPVLESFHYGLPIISFDDSALPETIGNAGIIIPNRDHALFAEAIHRLLTDTPLRKELIRRGKKRLRDHFTSTRAAGILAKHLRKFV